MCKWQDAFACAWWREAKTRRANALPDCDGDGGDGDDDDYDDGVNLRAVCLVRAIVVCVGGVVVDDVDSCW